MVLADSFKSKQLFSSIQGCIPFIFVLVLNIYFITVQKKKEVKA